jgi:predicted RNA polymerase sigma factor
VEASIAAVHAAAAGTDSTDWPAIVALYDTLLAIRPSPVVALNRAIAIAEFWSRTCVAHPDVAYSAAGRTRMSPSAANSLSVLSTSDSISPGAES